MFPELPNDFSLAHAGAIALLFVSWFAYPLILRLFGRAPLNSQLVIVRQHWIEAATRRPAKPFDAVLLGHITNSIAFFGSATLIVLAGIVSAIANVKAIHVTVSQLHFIAPVSLELFALELGLLAFVLALCFFSFTYALRKLIYTIALFGALPDAGDDCPTRNDLVASATMVLSEAIKTFNFGIRGYYYAIATLCLFLSPFAGAAATLIVTTTLIYRQLATPTAHAIQNYVAAITQWKSQPTNVPEDPRAEPREKQPAD
jgi:uncharacterized membrane protein